MQLDWRTLPPTVVAALPDPPPSAKRYLKRRAQQPERDDVDDFTQSFVSQKLAEWASRSLGSGMANDDDQIKAKQYPSLRRSLNDTSKENIRPPTRSASADANSHLFTTKQHDMSSISSSHPRGSKLSQQGSAPDPTVNTSDRPGKSPDTTTQMTSSIQTDIRNLAESHSALQVSRNAVESSRQYSELNSLLNQLQQIKDQVNGGRPERLKNDLRRSELVSSTWTFWRLFGPSLILHDTELEEATTRSNGRRGLVAYRPHQCNFALYGAGGVANFTSIQSSV